MPDLLHHARNALADNQLDTAVQLLLQASSQQPLDLSVWFTLATALARKGGQQTMCCIAYLRTLQLLTLHSSDEQGPAITAMASVSADNCWLLAEKLLPAAWPAALQDSTLNSSMCWGLMYHLSTVLQPAQPQQQHARAVDASTSEDSTSTDSTEQHVQLLCVGGLGVQAMQLAAAASEAQCRAVQAAAAAGGASVPSMGVAYMPSNQLTAHVASQLLLDNELDDIVDVCAWQEFMQQQRDQAPPTAVLALLAEAVQPNWGPAVTGCMQAAHRLAAFTSTSYSKVGSSMTSILCPTRIRVWAVPVSCQELIDLNEVNLQGIADHTAGRYNYAAANKCLRRNSRSAHVSRHNPRLLSAPAIVLELSLQQLLQELQQRYQSPQQRKQQQQQQQQQGPFAGSTTAAAAEAAGSCPVAAALVASRPAEVTTVLTVQQAGRVDCLVWWLEFYWGPGHSTAFAPPAATATVGTAADAGVAAAAPTAAAAAAGSAASQNSSSSRPAFGAAGCRAADMLQPHVWQHVQYLQATADTQQQQQQQQGLLVQGQQVQAGQQLLLHVAATAADLQMTASVAAAAAAPGADAPAAAAAAAAAAGADAGPRWQQQGGSASSNPSLDILPYHLSMLNDHARTVAYDKGIAGAVRDLLQGKQQPQQGVQERIQQLSLDGGAAAAVAAPVVLDVGCGTGLLSMMAATAAAAAGGSLCVTGCEREPALAQTAQQVMSDNSLQQQIKVVQKLSNQLSLAPDAAAADGKAQGAAGKPSSRQQQADLPGRAELIVHEIFGTDPLSEHVLPALQQVQQQLAAPGAVFMPNRVRIIAAVATCPTLLQKVRIQETLNSLVMDGIGSRAASAGTRPACQMPAWDVSSLLPLQPRKLELQLEDLQDQLLLLTAPQSVLEIDFQQPVKLSGHRALQLQGLATGVLLQDWMHQQLLLQGTGREPQHSGDSNGTATAAAGVASSPGGGDAGTGVIDNAAAGAALAAPVADQHELLVVSWFEADCGEGGWLSTAPGKTCLGHWQQSVEFVGLSVVAGMGNSRSGAGERPAAVDTAGGSYHLQVSWNHDRVSFTLLD